MTLFPHEGFPYRLDHKEGDGTKTCWFVCNEHLQKYLDRHKPIDSVVQVRDDAEPVKLKPVEVEFQAPPPVKRGRKKRPQLFSSLDTFFDGNK